MVKVKTTFFCQNCGAQSAQWMGKCKACKQWNTIVEEVVSKTQNKSTWKTGTTQKRKYSTKHTRDFFRK